MINCHYESEEPPPPMKSSRVSSRESSNRMRESAMEEIREALPRDESVSARASILFSFRLFPSINRITSQASLDRPTGKRPLTASLNESAFGDYNSSLSAASSSPPSGPAPPSGGGAPPAPSPYNFVMIGFEMSSTSFFLALNSSASAP